MAIFTAGSKGEHVPQNETRSGTGWQDEWSYPPLSQWKGVHPERDSRGNQVDKYREPNSGTLSKLFP